MDLRIGMGGIITPGVGPILRDVRLGLRRLRLNPGFTLFAVVSLAIGFAVSTAVYSAVHTLFWTPLGIPEPNEMVAIASGPQLAWMSALDFQDLQSEQTAFRSLAAVSPIRTAFTSARRADVVVGEAVSGGYFSVMGVGARYGRLLTPADERDGARVAVISEHFWRSHFLSDPDAIGQHVRLGGVPFEIVGVTAGPFHGIVNRYLDGSVWVPRSALPRGLDRSSFSAPANDSDRSRGTAMVYGRLRSGVAAGRAAGEIRVIADRLDGAYPLARRLERKWSLRLDATQRSTEGLNTLAGLILTGVGMLLLIACSNLANLALARGTSRAEETAVRSALGASRWRLVREQLIESGIVVLAGGGLGLWLLAALVDYFTVDLMEGLGQTRTFRPEIDGAVLAGSAVAMVVAVLVFGLWPALQATRLDVRTRLGTASSTPPRWRLHRNLIAWQVCGCVALTLVAVMTQRIISVTVRFTGPAPTAKVAVAQLDFALNGRDESQVRRSVDTLTTALRAQPDIQRVVASTGVPFPFVWARSSYQVTRPDAPASRSSGPGEYAYVIAATPGFLDVYGVRLLRGRGLTERDDAAAPRVAVISERLARTFFQSTDIAGQTVAFGRRTAAGRAPSLETVTIVGVCADPDGTPRTSRGDSYIFVPWAQRYEPDVAVILTAQSASPPAALGELRATIRRADPDLAISASGTGDVILQGPVYLFKIIAGLSTALAAMSLVLAMAGLFGVVSHLVMRRTRELGIRIALGADRRRIFGLILRDGLSPVGKGIVLGLTIGLGARMAVRSWVVTDIGAFEPLAFLLIPVPFIAAAFLACCLPAVRASRVDPNVALRDL
jgi:predicted permease